MQSTQGSRFDKVTVLATPAFLLGMGAFLYLRTFIFPWTPIYQGDTAPIFLLDAARLLQGEVMYRDFFELTFPGAPVLYWGLFKIFGPRAWIPSAALTALGLGFAWLGIAVSRRFCKGTAVYLPSLLFLTLTYGTTLDANHHWFSTLAIVGAMAVLLEARSWARLVGAGALCGLATWFTQSRGVIALAGFSIFLVWEMRRKLVPWRQLLKSHLWLGGGMLLAVLPVVYFAWEAGAQRFIYCTFTFVRAYYPYYRWNTWRGYMTEPPEFSGWVQVPALAMWLFVHLLVPLIFLLFLARYRREAQLRPAEPWERLMLVALTGLFLFLGIAFSPVWERLCTVALPACVLLVWFVESSGKVRRALLTVLWLAGFAVALVMPIMTQLGVRGYLDARTGHIAFTSTTFAEEDAQEKFKWVLEHTRPGESFFNGRDADLYFFLGLRNPAPVPFLSTSDYTRPEQVQQVIAGLEKYRVRLVMWWPELDLPEDAAHPEGDHLSPLRAYLCRHYRVAKTFSDGVQVWKRREEQARDDLLSRKTLCPDRSRHRS